MSGAKETQDVVVLVEKVVTAVIDSLADGKLNVFDVPKFAPLLGAIKDAWDGSAEIPGELKELLTDSELVKALLKDIGEAVLEILTAALAAKTGTK